MLVRSLLGNVSGDVYVTIDVYSKIAMFRPFEGRHGGSKTVIKVSGLCFVTFNHRGD